MVNSVDSDQTAPLGAVWSGSTLFAYPIWCDTLMYEILGHITINSNVQPNINNNVLYEFFMGVRGR